MVRLMRRVLVLLPCALVFGAHGEAAPLKAFAGVPPTAYLVERVGGEYVMVEALLSASSDPHTYEPTPRQVAALSNADFLFSVGMPFENALVQRLAANRPDLVIVDTSASIPKRTVDGHEEHGRVESEPDPHVWLSPPLLKIQAKNVADALMKADPVHESAYAQNLSAFEKDADAVHAALTQALTPYKGKTFYVFHPAFGYFAEAYGLRQKAVEVSGKSPGPRDLAELIKQAKSEGVRVIFVQPQFASASAQTIAEAIGGAAVPLDDLAKDVLRNLRDIADKVSRALEH